MTTELAACEALMDGFNICGDDRGCRCEDAQERADLMVAAVLAAAGGPDERALRERVAAEIIDVRRTDAKVKGAAGSTKRRMVDAALHEAALRVLTGEHAGDEYRDGWLEFASTDGARS